jgi:hypothetical protein
MDPKMLVALSMILDFGFKVWMEETKNMTEAELDAFIADKKRSTAEVEARIEAKYGA